MFWCTHSVFWDFMSEIGQRDFKCRCNVGRRNLCWTLIGGCPVFMSANSISIFFSFKSWSYWILFRPCWVLVGQGYSSFIFTFYLYLQVCFSSIFNFYFLNILAPWIQICVDAAIHFIPKYCMSLSDLYSMHAKK